MQPKIIKFTREGYQKLEADWQTLTEKRKGTVVSLRTAREMGDLSENGAYKAARFELSDIDRRLRRLKFLLRFGQIAEVKNTGVVGFGSRVTLDDGQKQMTFTLVEGYESDPKQQKLSVFSPIGKAIVGKRAGDKVIVTAPAGQTTYTIVNFE